MPEFIEGHLYMLEEIKNAFDGRGGNHFSVVVKDGQNILFIKFQPELNPHWETKGELWIHKGARCISDAQQWVSSKLLIPVFCGNGRSDWKYLGNASVELIKVGDAARQYTGDDRVEIVLCMNFDRSSIKSESYDSQMTLNQTESPLYTPEVLGFVLTRWLAEHQGAVQLDGSSKIRSNPSTFCYILCGEEIYRLQLDTRITSIRRFIKKIPKVRNAQLAFATEIFKGGKLKAIPPNSESEAGRKSDGWFCYYHRKATRNEKARAA